MALMLVLSGLLAMAVSAAGYLFRTVRPAEDLLPNHDAAAPAPAPSTAAPLPVPAPTTD
jgi:hypothetical protein